MVVGNQLAVKMVRVPVEQNTAEIKNDCTNRHEDPPLVGVITAAVWHDAHKKAAPGGRFFVTRTA